MTTLLDLPAELFSLVVQFLVDDVGILQAFTYRPICRKFAAEIYHNVVALQPRESFEPVCRSGHRDRLRSFFSRYGAQIMYRRLHAPRGFNPLAFSFIRNVVDALLRHQRNPLDSDYLCRAYSRNVCKAMTNAMGRDFLFSMLYDTSGWANKVLSDAEIDDVLPTAAAAVGDIGLLQQILPPSTLYPGNRFLLGTPLEAAATTGQCDVIEMILNTTKVPLETLHNAIHEAIRITIVYQEIKAQRVLLNFVQKRGVAFIARKQKALKSFTKSWMISGQEWPLYPTLALYCNGAITIDLELREYLFERGQSNIIKRLICDGYINPNEHIHGVSPLLFTVIKKRCHSFETLLENGVDVDGVAIQELGVTALWHSVHIGEKSDVKLLLEHAADPDFASGTWRSPIEEALQNDDQDILSTLAEFQAKRGGGRRRLVQEESLGLWQWDEGGDESVHTREENIPTSPEVSHAQFHSPGNGNVTA